MSITGRLTPAVAASAFALILGSSAFGQAQSKDQQKCINTLNKDTWKVATAQGKENSGCVKAGTKGTATSGCLTADAKGKVAKKEAKASADEGKNGCLGANAPNFGYAGVTAGTAAAVAAELNLFSDTYGTTDPTAVISIAKADGKCQSAVTKDLEKLIATKWKQYVKCKKTTLKAGATNAAALQACLSGDPNSIAADPKGKIAKKLAKLDGDIGRDCGTSAAIVSIAADFPGRCSGSTTGNLATCLDEKAECRICEALNSTDGLSENCDRFDDGVVNGSCPGRYIQISTGGSLKVTTFAAYPFPTGSVTIQDVGLADVNGVSNTVVPLGGSTTPAFCVPALGATSKVTQSGCGVGKIDWNGGSDFTITEHGDTSETMVCNVNQPGACSPGTCSGFSTGSTCATGPKTGNMCHGPNQAAADAMCGLCTVGSGLTCLTNFDCACPSTGPAPDSSGRLDITVGDSVADTCPAGGTANSIYTIPVNTLTWVAADSSCPDSDGTFNPGTDTQLALFPQTLDLTTDTSNAQFMDLGEMDGCAKSGLGPTAYAGAGANGVNSFCLGAGNPSACCTGVNTGTCTGPTGQCINTVSGTINVAGAGTIFSSGGPTYDLLFATVQNAILSGPFTPVGDTCSSPPVINFSGAATRCIVAP